MDAQSAQQDGGPGLDVEAEGEVDDFRERMGLGDIAPAAATRRGRPRGSKNRAPERTRALIRELGGDPLLAAAQIVAGGPEMVMRLAIATHQAIAGSYPAQPLKVMPPAQALAEWRRVVEVLMPYMGQKLPLDVHVDVPDFPPLQVFFGKMAAAAAQDDVVPSLDLAEIKSIDKSSTCTDGGAEVSRDAVS